MMTRFLKMVFGHGTRAVQTFNYLISTVWFVLLLLHGESVMIINLPQKVIDSLQVLLSGFVVVQIVGAVGFVTANHYKHQLLKGFTLLLGALLQLILAMSYVTAYPPFDIAIIVNTCFAVWFVLAVLFIVMVEGINGGVRA